MSDNDFFLFVMIALVVLMAWAQDRTEAAKRKRVHDAYNGFNPKAVHGHRNLPTDEALKKAGLI